MTTPEPHYELKSELARWSFVAQRSQADRRLAWVNSICALFLLIGVAGARTHPPPPLKPPPLEEAAPIVVEPLPPPPPTDNAPAPEQNQPEQAPASPVIVVPDSPTIHFSVPTVGTLVAPEALAQAPPPAKVAEERKAPAPSGPETLYNTGGGGERPAPNGDTDYPEMAKKFGQQGTVVLLLTAGADGSVASVDIQKTSGYTILDRASINWVTLHWKLPQQGESGQHYQASISWVLLR